MQSSDVPFKNFILQQNNFNEPTINFENALSKTSIREKNNEQISPEIVLPLKQTSDATHLEPPVITIDETTESSVIEVPCVNVETTLKESELLTTEIKTESPFKNFIFPRTSFSKPTINFENALSRTSVWEKNNEEAVNPKAFDPLKQPPNTTSLDPPVITIDETTKSSEIEIPSFASTETPLKELELLTSEIKSEENIDIKENNKDQLGVTVPELSVPQPVPIITPTPRKRGRPRKQVLPNPSPLVESWGPNAQQFLSIDVSKEQKQKARAERRARKKKLNENDGDIPKQRYISKKPVKPKKRKSTYIPKKRGPYKKKNRSELENIQNFEEETRMSASEAPGGFSSKAGEDSQGSSVTTEGHTKSNINKKGRMEVIIDGCKPVTVQQIVEYFWPPPSSLPQGEKPEGLMIQEQISEYLGVKSFKRKYPSIKRRPVEMEERNYLQENGFVSENMCDMGLTAVFSTDIIEIMYNDFPHKFEEYRKHTREKKAKEQRALREKQAAERADMDPLKEAIESASLWNNDFNKTRREKRASCFDLQTFTVHFPANRYKRISLGRPGHYPIALIPGQNTDYYKKYTSNELKYFPLNTVLYGPLRPNERHFGLLGGSDGSQSEIDDSSSSDESSSSSSEETQDTDATSSTVEEEIVNNKEDKTEKLSEVKEEKGTLKIVKNVAKTPKGRGRGKVIETNTPVAPKKRLGRPPKIKVAAVKVKKLNDDEIADVMKDEKTDIAMRVIIHTCKMCHEEESKNKNGEFEKFIECSQCKGKIHPSCIDLTAEMIPKISSYGWQCTDCKSCVHCEKSSNEDKMIFCDQCDRGYHIFCVGLSEVPSGNYICHVCKPESLEKNSMVHKNENDNTDIKIEVLEIKEEIKTEEENVENIDS